jgi:NitT/TauT family transport system substrate-binding protein
MLGLLLAAACQPSPAAPPPASAPPAATVAQPATPERAAVAPPTAAASPTPAALVTVRVGTNNAGADAPFHVAQERGYLREQGLELEFTPFDSAQQMIAPLGADQLDVGGGGPGPGLFNAIQRGVNVRIVADRARAAPGSRFNCLMVRKDLLDGGAVRTMADLRGRVFAEPVPGNVMTYVYERQLRQAGVRPDEVTYATVPFPEMMSAFANGIIDAAIPVEPFNTLGAQRGIAECWRYTGEMDPNFQIAVVLFGPAFAEQRVDVARRFMVAHLHGMRDYYRAFFGDGEGRGELLELLTRTTSLRDLALLERVAPTWMDPNGGVNLASLQSVQHWYLDRGELSSEVDLGRVVDPSFVDYAISRLGRYPTP